ncbi:MAG TPA: cellulose binding domain-containing protein, partial [Actinoplanes sp.]|nr:cellulose binding domain-containing protein [Actinoplanes sp.]
MKRPLWRAVMACAAALFGAVLVAVPAQAAEPSASPAPALTPAPSGGAPLPPPPSIAAGQNTATFAKQGSWDTGYVGLFTVTNGSDYKLTWSLDFELPAGTTVQHFWSTRITRTGQRYTAVGEQWNATIQPGTSVTFGFIAGGTGAPTSWRVNQGPCAGPGCAAPDIRPPTTPLGLHEIPISSMTILRWYPSSDDVGVVRYEVFVPGFAGLHRATVTGTEYRYQEGSRPVIDMPSPVATTPPPPAATPSPVGTTPPPVAPIPPP